MITTLQLIGGLALLYFGAEWLVKGAVAIAANFKVSPLIIGLTLVAFATSAPELTVSLEAALNGAGDISMGNVIGSNICNIALILGISALISPLSVKTRLLQVDMPLLLAVTVVFAVMGLLSGGIGRIEGAILFSGLIVYTVWSVRASRREEVRNPVIQQECAEDLEQRNKPRRLVFSLLLAAGGLIALIVGGKFLVVGAIAFGQWLGVSDAVIGLTVVAVGTSLPELATSIVAAARRQQDIAIGNVVGSNLFNILGIMGLVPLIQPVETVNISRVDWGTMVFLTALLLPLMRTRFEVNRTEGGFLLGIFALYVSYLCIG